MHPGPDQPASDRLRSDFPDRARITRNHAGELIADTHNWPGVILVLLGVVGAALTLTAAGYGFAGWAIVAGIATALCLICGGGLILAEHRRVKADEGRELLDPGGH
ncbi:hypothetical protein [Nocardia anaemiae]|uniref:hypothetical protein n=1 Tax=Nocardia anaemiae TaxID=263910 RepID=UPI0007A4C89E|nr:hypothetical protein [Nocardia anaemiae]